MISKRKPMGYSCPLPTLSMKGWVTGMNEKIDRIFSYYLTNQYSQTVHHLGHVKSLQYTVKQCGSTPELLAKTVEDDLKDMFDDYVDVANIKVSYKERETGPEVDYTIEMLFIHNGNKWNINKQLEIKDSKFKEIIGINNKVNYSFE